MSVSASAPGPVNAAATVWTSSLSSGFSQGHESSACGDGCCAPSAPRINIASVLSQGNVRGELSGDNCFCVELGEDKVCGAVWSETDFVSLNLRTAISGAVGITPNGNKLLVEGIDRDDELDGILFGSDAERSVQKNPNVDVIYPTQMLCDQSSCRKLEDVNFEDTEENVIDLTKSSLDADKVSISPEQALSLLILHWYNKTKAQNVGGATSGAKKKKKGKINKLVTLVVPGYFGVLERANAVKGVRAASMDVRNIFSRGLACVAAALTNPTQATTLYSTLQSWMTRRDCSTVDCCTPNSGGGSDPIVLFVHTSPNGFEVALIKCERPRISSSKQVSAAQAHNDHSHHDHVHSHSKQTAKPVTNLMGFDRLLCLATGGGPFKGMALGRPIIASLRILNLT